MLIVTSPQNLNDDLLLLLGNYSIYNVSSMMQSQTIQKLDIYPTNIMMYETVIQSKSSNNLNEYQLDQVYVAMLMNNDAVFMQFMKIMRDLYFGVNVVLLVYREEQVFDGITESLCKFIQQRYGYNYQLINVVEDLNENDNSNFTVSGIINFDADNSRYLKLLASLSPDVFNEDIEKLNMMNGWSV